MVCHTMYVVLKMPQESLFIKYYTPKLIMYMESALLLYSKYCHKMNVQSSVT